MIVWYIMNMVLPIGSMYAIYGNIYIPYVDPMGNEWYYIHAIHEKKNPVVDHVFPNQIWSNGIIKIQGIYPTLRHTHIVPYSRLPRLRWYFSWKMLKVWHTHPQHKINPRTRQIFFFMGYINPFVWCLKSPFWLATWVNCPSFLETPASNLANLLVA